MINPKDTTKATDAEKNCCAMVINQIEKSLKELTFMVSPLSRSSWIG